MDALFRDLPTVMDDMGFGALSMLTFPELRVLGAAPA